MGQISQTEYRETLLRLHGLSQPDEIEHGMRILAEEDDGICFFEGVQQTLLVLKQRGFYWS
jgi:hypothetical protein